MTNEQKEMLVEMFLSPDRRDFNLALEAVNNTMFSILERSRVLDCVKAIKPNIDLWLKNGKVKISNPKRKVRR